MAIKKAKANFYISNTEYDTYHYETQSKQVKILDANGAIVKDLDTELSDIKKNISDVDGKAYSNEATIENITMNIGSLSTLETTAKTLVPAVNEVKKKTDSNSQSITAINVDIAELEDKLSFHNHDNVYVKRSGGEVTGTIALSNGVSFASKNTSGVPINIGMIDDKNQTILGNINNQTHIFARNGEVKVWDGKVITKVFHEGNMGHGSGLDADKVDGIQGASLARRDADNHFTGDQIIRTGRSLYLRADDGSSQAGSVFWQDGSGVQVARLRPNPSGDIAIFNKDSNWHTFKANGDLFSTGSHIFDSNGRETSVRFRADNTDSGMGFYMNNASKNLGFHDWENGKRLFNTDRASGMIEFVNALKIQGRKFSIQWTEPASPAVGDIWINIDA